MAQFHENLKALRTEAGLTQRQLADAIGMDISSYNKIENGKGDPQLSTIQKIAQGLGISPSAFHEPLRVLVPASGSRMVPVLDTWTLVPWLQSKDNVPEPPKLPVSPDFPGRGFAFGVNGMSMMPWFAEGDVVLVDRKREPDPGDLVVGHDGRKGYLRRYAITGEPGGGITFELVPDNTFYPRLRSSEGTLEVVGVCVRHLRSLHDAKR